MRIFSAAALFLMLVCPAQLSAQEPEVMFDIPSETVPTNPDPEVINGKPAAASDWPATRKSGSRIENGKTVACTATIIGPRVILTAAHCVANGAMLSIETGQGRVSAQCERHPHYDPVVYSNDIALCSTKDEIRLANGKLYERLNTSPSTPRRNSSVIVLGYGCTSPSGSGSTNLVAGVTTAMRATNNGVILGKGSVLCEGDSGGAAYQLLDSSLQPTPRVVIGVNSTRSVDYTHSTVTNVAAPDIATFIDDWAVRKGVTICGYGAPPALCQPAPR